MFRKSLSIALGISAGALLSASLLAQTGYQTQSPQKQTDTSRSTAGTDTYHSGTDTSRSRSGTGRVDSSDADFLKKAAAGGEAEVELGKLASEKASDPQVKKFGQTMVRDHSKVNNELSKLARRKDVDVPSSLEDKDQKEKDRLSKLSGADFDRAYMKLMVSDHEKDVSEFEKMAKKAKDPDVRSFASSKLPKLKEHLNMAKSDKSRIASHSTRAKTEKTS
jgi:putative membrane protein